VTESAAEKMKVEVGCLFVIDYAGTISCMNRELLVPVDCTIKCKNAPVVHKIILDQCNAITI
jgi:hypothetical protein